jgi:N-acetylglucosamine kinase-like BadF-type ATPase
VPSLGWLVGDEGSGNHMGKALLRAYVYRELPSDLEGAFEKTYPEGIDSIKNKIYDLEANAYLASFTKFMGDNIEHPVIRDLVETSLSEFLDRHVAKYKGYKKVPIHFVGSIAHHFSSVLLDCMKKREMIPGVILRKPIFSLADYHALGND